MNDALEYVDVFIDEAEKIMVKAEEAEDIREAIELTKKMYELKARRFRWMKIEDIDKFAFEQDGFCPLCSFMNKFSTELDRPCHVDNMCCPLEDYVVNESIEDGTCCKEYQTLADVIEGVVEGRVSNDDAQSDFWEAFNEFKTRVDGL